MAAEVKQNAARVRSAWGAKAPDWVAVLATECDRSSQSDVAERLGNSAAVVNQVLGNVYKGRMDRVEARVRGEFMKAVVQCPVVGEISTRDCAANQQKNLQKKFRPTNPLRVALRKACPRCPNREGACSSK